MIVADISPSVLRRQLRGPGFCLRTGPVVTRIRSRLSDLADSLMLQYAAHEVASDEAFADFHVSVNRPPGLRRWLAPQVEFRFDSMVPFAPLPGDQGFPMLEWGLNWCVSSQCHQYLILHAAVLERDGRALILPAPSGSGKSTLCAGLLFRGWRLLSDELTLIEPRSGAVVPLPRPVSLKNGSIDVIRTFAPAATLGPVVHETVKGSVAHMRPPIESVRRSDDAPLPGWVIIPRYVADATAELCALPKARTFMRLAESAFNYHLHGRRGFETLGRLVDVCDCYEFAFSRLDEATDIIARLSTPSMSPVA